MTPTEEDDFFTREVARQDAARVALCELTARVREMGAAELTSRTPGYVAAITRDPSRPEGWRVTRFDEEGPVGHTECETLESAVREAWAQGFRTMASGAVDSNGRDATTNV